MMTGSETCPNAERGVEDRDAEDTKGDRFAEGFQAGAGFRADSKLHVGIFDRASSKSFRRRVMKWKCEVLVILAHSFLSSSSLFS